MRIISRFCNYLSYLFAANLAQSLKFTDAFTVEGWIKPVRTKSSPEMQVLFSTRVDIANGWHLTFWRNKNNDGKTYLTLYAYNASVLVSDFEMSGDLSSLQDWTHVALTYDPSEGNGTWRSYVNGVLAATAENAVKPTLTTGYAKDFYIAGRYTEHCFYGCMDAVRVSGATLTSDQLLCGANGETAPSPLALWPLDTVNGMIFDGKDLKGSYSFGQGAANFAAWSDDAPSIANPERNEDFRGEAERVGGSYDLSQNRYSYLGFAYPDASKNFVTDHEPFTFECYVKRTKDVASREVFLYNTIGATMSSYGTDRTLFYMLVDGKLLVNDGTWEATPVDRYFCDDTNLFPKGEWTHVAFVRTFEGGRVCHELFINGKSRGKVSGTAKASAKSAGVCMIGGRSGTEIIGAFGGLISSVRISQSALTPAEFLCGEPPAVTEPETILNEKKVQPGLALKNLAPLAAPFSPMTLEMTFAWSGVDGNLVETPQGVVGIRDGKLFVDFKGAVLSGTYVLKASDLLAFTQGEKIGCAFVWSQDGMLTIFARGSRLATLTSEYVPPQKLAQAGDLVLGSAATGELRKVRVTASALDEEELLQSPGLVIIFR